MVKLNKFLLLFAMLFLCVASVMATGEIKVTADPINYWSAMNHTITVENTGTLATVSNFDGTWTAVGTTGNCVAVANNVTCTETAGQIGTFTVTSDGAVGEYAKHTIQMTTDNAYTANPVTLVRMQPNEIFRTLVEYGRGRGNYFFDSGTNRKGEQCSDLPANKDIELNYLHKVYPIINNYLNIPTAEGQNLTYYCTYPNSSITKQHLAENVVFSGSQAQVSFTSDWLKSSWEKVFFLVQDFTSTEFAPGETMTVTCSNMKYYLPDANGWVSGGTDSFTFTFRDETPMTVSATSNVAQIGTGTSEVEITYTITNTESMVLSSSTNPLMIDIKAPQYAQFIGTRGELWGTGQDVYHYQLNRMEAGEVQTITLVARFSTSGTGTIPLSQGVTVSYVPCWQINAYNPMAVEQSLSVAQNITVNSTVVAIKGVQSEIASIQSKLDAITATVTTINTTVNQIQSLSTEINTTVAQNQALLQQINTTVTATNNVVNVINTSVAQNQAELVNMLTVINSTTTDSYAFLQNTIMNSLNELNMTTQETKVLVTEINQTTHSVSVKVDNVQSTVNGIDGKVDTINGKVDTINLKIDALTGDVSVINTTVNGIQSSLTTVGDNVVNMNTTINNNLNNMNSSITNNLNNMNSSITAQFAVVDGQLVIMNSTLNQILNLTGQQGGDWTARFDSIDSGLVGLGTDVRKVQEFSEESIYLITDSITEGQNSYKEALTSLSTGDTDKAMSQLQSSIDKLTQAEKQLSELKAQEQTPAVQEQVKAVEQQKASLIEVIMSFFKNLFK